jgi:hypothetical protein
MAPDEPDDGTDWRAAYFALLITMNEIVTVLRMEVRRLEAVAGAPT